MNLSVFILPVQGKPLAGKEGGPAASAADSSAFQSLLTAEAPPMPQPTVQPALPSSGASITALPDNRNALSMPLPQTGPGLMAGAAPQALMQDPTLGQTALASTPSAEPGSGPVKQHPIAAPAEELSGRKQALQTQGTQVRAAHTNNAPSTDTLLPQPAFDGIESGGPQRQGAAVEQTPKAGGITHSQGVGPEFSVLPTASGEKQTLASAIATASKPVSSPPQVEVTLSQAISPSSEARSTMPAPAAHAPSPAPAADQPPALTQIRAAIEQRDGAARIEIRLDPPELGRVQIEFEMRGNGQLRAIIQATEGDTLELMRRHGESLEQDLREQGFGDLSFEWRQGAQDQKASGLPSQTPEPSAPMTQSDPTSNVRMDEPAGTSLNLRL
jgi:flagellar hook-length control protein FliK